ncbi:FCD domain-containing protein [Paenisporosarcina sp. TG20]|uniref:FCD domain-containing protein n=1 Tax=Paenisporosarcina sp. TG20 TaxID=1211706 RepID=UPI000594F617
MLYAWKVIEIETIKLIVQHTRDEHIKLLQDSVDNHVAGIDKESNFSINFHEIIAELSDNRFLCSALKLLLHEEVIMENKFCLFKERRERLSFSKGFSSEVQNFKI